MRPEVGQPASAGDGILSVMMPVYNEARTVEIILRHTLSRPEVRDVVVVDDGSTDGTWDVLSPMAEEDSRIRLLRQQKNQGKGAALRLAIEHLTAPFALVQDADLEYDPAEYPRLLQPIIEGKADVVFGSRFIGETHRVLYYWHSIGNKVLTHLSNFFTDLNLTDMETCYKVFRREVIQGINLKSNRFGFEPEVTAKVAKKRNPSWRVYEVPISYSGRTYEEGKKIGLKDAFNALYCIVRYWLKD
jgi:glycosyltransferase involved in cell wall biosynthesis